MAAAARDVASRDLMYQNHYKPVLGEDLTYGTYLKGLNISDILDRTFYTAAIANGGACYGAIIGTAIAGPAGTAPGIAIGAGVGLLAGVACNQMADLHLYVEYKNNLTENARLQLDEVVNEKMGPDAICAICSQIPKVPVRIRGEAQVYERDALKKWCLDRGTSPLTRRHFDSADIVLAEDALINIGRVCDEILNNPRERAKYIPEILKGFAILRKETIGIAEKSFESQGVHLVEALKQRKISPKNFKLESAALADLYDPIIGEEASERRMSVDDKKIDD